MRNLILVFICLFLISCSDREHANPFDPENPDTKGAPTGVSVISNRDSVFLRWNPMEVNDLLYYLVYRMTGEGDLATYDTVNVSERTFLDTTVVFDTKYSYAVQANTVFNKGTLSDTVSIIPGPYNFWIADFYNYSVKRITYDGVHVIKSDYFTSPIAIEADPQRNQFLIADYWNKCIYIIDKNFLELLTIDLEDRPVDIAVNSSKGEFYVLFLEHNQLVTYSISGRKFETINLPFDVSFYTYLTYDSVASNVWISGNGADSVFQFVLENSTSVLKVHSGIVNPGKIYADPITGGCWIASDSGIVRISDSGVRQIYKTNYYIADLSINPKNGDCYYTGYTLENGFWETGYISDQGSVKILGNDYPYLSEIQVVPGEGAQGFIVAQKGTWRIIRFDSTGTEIGELGSFDARLDFALE
ncbi:MAG: hypothetical protein DRP89_06025 [Candidatus Neomarinimicrobiota bacterium]|nr:MAG: hypothetical protein DRP89_06025 [Candidatus Neomarinimicrobiota bacterium]